MKKNISHTYRRFIFTLPILVFLFFGIFGTTAHSQSTQERLDILTGRMAAPPDATALPPPAAATDLPEVGPSVPIPPEAKRPRRDTSTSSPDEANTVVVVDENDCDLYPRPKTPTMRDQAFKELLDKISPLSPEQIIEMRRQQDRTQRAVATPVDTPPRPVSSTLTVDLSPGATPPIVRLGFGFVTSIVFVDSTGQSWPIADYNLGNPKYFNIQWDKKTNTLFMQATAPYTNGNLAVRLATLDTPLMLSLVSGQKEVDYRVDVRVPGRGPNALAEVVGDGLPPAPNPLLLSVLDGVPPPGSVELEVCGCCGRAWLYKGKVLFRSQLAVLSPAWSATVSSMDGTRVYELNPTPLIIASHNGKPIKIVLKGY